MAKTMLKVAAIACGAVFVMALRKRQQGTQAGDKWAKMRMFMEEMPEDFPPRVMFDNLAATRENTERILEILQGHTQSAESPDQDSSAA